MAHNLPTEVQHRMSPEARGINSILPFKCAVNQYILATLQNLWLNYKS